MRHLKTIEVDEDTQIHIGQDMISGDFEARLIWDGDIVRRVRAETPRDAEVSGRRLAYEFAGGAHAVG